MANSAFSLSTSVSLIHRVQSVEPGAWETLLKLYGPLVYRYARHRGVRAEDAADLIQIVFLSVWRGIHNFTLDRPDATFRGWLHTITQNAVREQVRRKKVPLLFSADLADELDAGEATIFEVDGLENPGEELFSHLTNRALQFVRETVDSNTWESFWRTTLEDQPVDLVASQ